jgi:hypothetical protein
MRIDLQIPVFFSGNNGGGPGEIGFPDSPSAATTVPVNVQLAAGESIIGAWYTPLDNVGGIDGFSHIEIRWTPTQVNVTALGNAGAGARVRVQLYTLIKP